MKIIKQLTLLIIVFTITSVNAQWRTLNNGNFIEKSPTVQVLKDTNKSTIISVEVTGFKLTDKIVDGKVYQEINLLTDSYTNKIGEPSLPVIPSLVAVPDEASVSLEIIETGTVTTYNNINILPGRKSWIDGQAETAYIKNAIYSKNEMYPTHQATIDEPAIYRDFRIVRLGISPFQYNPVTKQLKVVSSFKIRLNYKEDGNAINPRTTGRKHITTSYDKLYKTSILNYNNQQKSINDTYVSNDLMLCIVPDNLYNDFLPYAEWKRRTGVDVHVTKFSDIGANANNPITIRNHIDDAYHNWATPPSYVLLVGDYGVFPTKTYNANDGWSFADESYFVTVDGNDFLPDMLVGRFTNQGNYRMRVMMNKFEKYIREPYVAETAWYKKGLFSSNSEYQSQVNTIAWTRDILLNYANFTSVDPMMWNGSFDANGNWDGQCNYSVTDVLAGLNEGRSVVNYRGEGWITGWHDQCIEFGSNDLSGLNPSRKNFFFTNIGCGVAMFDNSYECFGENLVEYGTIANPKGAIAFVGPTSNTHTTYNNKMDKGIHKGMYQEGLDTPGEALDRGRIYQYAVFGGSDYYVEYHHRVFCVLGDPSIQIWKEVPLAVNVNHVSYLPTGNNNVTIAVNYQATSLPAENARVTLTNANGLFITGTTDANGNITFNIDVDSLAEINVTVVGEDVITYEGVINMTTAGINDMNTDLANFNSQPNPFSTNTKINYTLLKANNTSIKIFNINGQLVRNLQNDMQSAGNHSVEWNGLNDKGSKLTNGIYFCHLVSGKNVRTLKLILND